MTIAWLLFLFVPFFLYLLLMDIHANREKKERNEVFDNLKQEVAGDPEKLRLIEIHEIEANLNDKIADMIEVILSDEVSDDLYKGAFNDYKPDIKDLAECITNHGYQPNMFDDKVLNIIEKLAQDPELTFLMKHGTGKEAEIRHELKKQSDKEK